jgi:hypothetical protein
MVSVDGLSVDALSVDPLSVDGLSVDGLPLHQNGVGVDTASFEKAYFH